ncbi:hypothetical protein D9M69_668720 [compost metagenome]
MQEQHGITTVPVHALDYRVAHLQPIGLGHVGTIEERRQLAEYPVGYGTLRMGELFGLEPGFETGGRGKAGVGHLHADGAAGVEHQELAGGGHGFSVLVVVQSRHPNPG